MATDSFVSEPALLLRLIGSHMKMLSVQSRRELNWTICAASGTVSIHLTLNP